MYRTITNGIVPRTGTVRTGTVNRPTNVQVRHSNLRMRNSNPYFRNRSNIYFVSFRTL